MCLIDVMNWCGRRKQFRLIGLLILSVARKLPFAILVKIAGRRIITASAGAPAILLTKSTITEAVKDPGLLYKAASFAVEKMGLDTLFLFVDMSLEAEACGCQVHYDDFHVPSVVTHPVKKIDDLTGLKVPDPYRDGRMPVFLEAMRMMKKNYTMLKIGTVCGPFTLAMSLAGTDILMDTIKNQQKVHVILEYCEKVIVRYAQALIKAGADMLLIAEPAGSQLSSSTYEGFSLPYTKKIINSLKRPCVLHICGKAGHLVPKMCLSGAASLSLDDVDMNQVIKNVPHNIVVTGNISPLKFSRSSPEVIKNQTINLLESTKTRKEFLAAPGCDLPPETPLENVTAFIEAAINFRHHCPH